MATKPNVEKLAEDIRASAESNAVVITGLETSQRIIARVTDGIYREPWAAFRELIANSYDADATRVVVETGKPTFKQIVVRDDGNGMSPETLAYMLKNIGGSSKRTHSGAELQTVRADDPNLSPAGRPLIGKIGIGLFAVAQLTQHFQIITKAKGGQLRSSATVKLKTHDELKQAASDKDYVAGEVAIRTESVADAEISKGGTTIVLYSLRPEIRKVLMSVRRWDAVNLHLPADGANIAERPQFHIGEVTHEDNSFRIGPPKLPWSDTDSEADRFKKLFAAASAGAEKTSKPANLAHFDEYLQLIWKLSLSLPLKYIEKHPYEINGDDRLLVFKMPSEKGQAIDVQLGPEETLEAKFQLESPQPLRESKFEVMLDGVRLARPVSLSDKLRNKSRVPAPIIMIAKEQAPFSGEVLERAGGELEFEAYLYWNSKVVPKDTAGVLLRIRDASGTLFDSTFLNYQISEQSRLRQITAEIFVTKGLDGAVNIDRESFNYSHPHYLYVQRWLHRALRLLINRIKAISDDDRKREKASHQEERLAALENSAIEVWERRRGESSDPPYEKSEERSLPPEIGSAAMEWPNAVNPENSDLATAVAVVLESYGVLSSLSSDERASLISDLVELVAKA